MASRKKLSLVGSENNECSLQSADFADTLEEWHALEARLQSLYKKNDDLLGDSPEDQTIAADLRKIQSDVEQELRELLHVIALKPAKNVHDIIAKLEIWKSMIIPDGCDPALAQPADQIVNSVLSDLIAAQAGK